MKNEKTIYTILVENYYTPKSTIPMLVHVSEYKISDHDKLKSLIKNIDSHEKVENVYVSLLSNLITITFNVLHSIYYVNYYKIVFRETDKKDVITFIKQLFKDRVIINK